MVVGRLGIVVASAGGDLRVTTSACLSGRGARFSSHTEAIVASKSIRASSHAASESSRDRPRTFLSIAQDAHDKADWMQT